MIFVVVVVKTEDIKEKVLEPTKDEGEKNIIVGRCNAVIW